MVGKPLTSADPSGIGDYTLVSRLGEGGMGVVYLATDKAGKKVALKVIRPHLASHEQFLERFRSEVALARKVARFCTAPILDSNTDSDPPYIVTEFVDGPTLTAAVAENGPLSGSELHALGVGVASALTAIHRVGIVHRDLKPSNVLLSRYGPRVIDFGIAKAVDAMTDITQTGQFIGSPSYTAPERYQDQPMTPLTDIFAWGTVLAFAGTGRPPFGDVPEAITYRVVHGEPDLEGLDPQLSDIVTWTLSKKPADRPTAQQLLEALLHQSKAARQLPAGPSATTSAAPATHPVPISGSRRTSPPVEPTTQLQQPAFETLTAVVPPPRRTAKVIASAVAVAVLLAGAAGGGWYAWEWAKKPNSASPPGAIPSASPSPSASPTPTPAPDGGTGAVTRDDAAVGPAPEIPGAKKGGTISGLGMRWETLDPQSNYEPTGIAVGQGLLYRTLTGYVQDDKGGLRLVGDLATDTGRSSADGRVWTYTLRKDIAFEDGTPITSRHIAYGVARSFAKVVRPGPKYIQNWLVGTPTMSDDFSKHYPGPYASLGEAPVPGIELPDDHTITFKLSRPHPEFPLVAALGTTSPVRWEQDTRGDYGKTVVASGPYKIAKRTETHLELVRNLNWKPESDPIRHAYPAKWVFDRNFDAAASTERVLSPTGKYAFAWQNVPSNRLSAVRSGAAKSLLSAPTPATEYLAINTQRVTDLTVRQAINAAIDRQAAMERYRGANFGAPSVTILSSAMPGHKEHSGLGVPVRGDLEKAKSLLAGRSPSLRVAYEKGSASQRRLVEYIQGALEKAGFTIQLVPVDGFWDAVEDRTNTYDLYPYLWGSDLPDGTGVFDQLFSGDSLERNTNKNVSYLDSLEVNSTITALQAKADRSEAARLYGELDEMILRDYAPIVPLFEQHQISVFGAGLGGLRVHRVYGTVGLENAYTK